PSELTGILTGTLLVATIAADRFARRAKTTTLVDTETEEDMKNSQLAILCTAIVGSALLVAGTNVWLVRSLQESFTSSGSAPTGPSGKRPVVAVMPKAKGDPYFVSCRVGAEQAAKDQNVEL